MSDDKTSENKMAHYGRQSEAFNTNEHVCWLVLLSAITAEAPRAQTNGAEERCARCGFSSKRQLIIADVMGQLFIFMYLLRNITQE